MSDETHVTTTKEVKETRTVHEPAPPPPPRHEEVIETTTTTVEN